MTPVAMPDPSIVVYDSALPDPMRYRDDALALPYQSYTLGVATFHGIALAPPTMAEVIAALDASLQPSLTFFRQSPKGQAEPNYIHSDRSMGQWTALLYLTPDPPEEDGTIFWEHAASGARYDASDTLEEYADQGRRWVATDDWRPWHRVAAVFNRLLIFPASYYHSRAIFENYGEGDTSRLVNVTFGVYAPCP